MPAAPIVIDLLNPLDRAYTNEPVPLHLLIRCAPGVASAELRQIACLDSRIAEMETDLFERDLKIVRGEVYRCAVSARFYALGVHREPLFYIQVGRDTDSHRVRVPTPPIHVVPSLLRELRVQVESICVYEYGTKIELTVKHVGNTKFEDFRLTVGPDELVRAGVSDQRRPTFNASEEIKLTTVLAAEKFELAFDAAVGGERIGPVKQHLLIPKVKDTATTAPFRFLEPKKLTQADLKIHTLDEANERVFPKAGFYEVSGGGAKYRVEIKPAHPHVKSIQLRSVSGSVEVTEIPSEPGAWAFQMVVLMNGVLTTPIVVHYDVTTPEGPQQGELNLAVHPQSSKLWLVALTAGGALTLKGLAAVVPAFMSQVDVWNTLGEALTKVNNLWDLIQFLSIPIIRGALWVADKIAWPLQES